MAAVRLLLQRAATDVGARSMGGYSALDVAVSRPHSDGNS